MEKEELLKYYNVNNWDWNNIEKDNIDLPITMSRKKRLKCLTCGEYQYIDNSQIRKRNAFCKNCKRIFISNICKVKFDRLKVTSVYKDDTGRLKCNCLCDCGSVLYNIPITRLVTGNTKSCGCYKSDITIERNIKHNLCGTRIYAIYSSMKDRCYNKNNKKYIDYGRRGIYICDEWLGENGVISFYNWSINNGYSDSPYFSIDRIDNNGPYAPWNCRWTDQKTQARNTRRNTIIPGTNLCVSEIAELYNFPYHYIYRNAIERGISLNTILKENNKLVKPVIFENRRN